MGETLVLVHKVAQREMVANDVCLRLVLHLHQYHVGQFALQLPSL